MLRLNVMFNDVHDIETELFGLFTIVNSILFRYHHLICHFDIETIKRYFFHDKIAYFDRGVGESLNGSLYMEILIRKKRKSEFHISYYSPELDFERLLHDVEFYCTMNRVNLNDYEPQFTLKDFREGDDQLTDSQSLKYDKVRS